MSIEGFLQLILFNSFHHQRRAGSHPSYPLSLLHPSRQTSSTMLADISKGTILYLTPVLMLTALLLSLFSYLAPTVMLHSQVALLTVMPSSALTQPGSSQAVDGPSIFLGPLGSCSRPNNKAGLTCTPSSISPVYSKYLIIFRLS